MLFIMFFNKCIFSNFYVLHYNFIIFLVLTHTKKLKTNNDVKKTLNIFMSDYFIKKDIFSYMISTNDAHKITSIEELDSLDESKYNDILAISIVDNNIEKIPEKIYNFKNLEFLDIGIVEHISPKIKQLTNLKILNLAKNKNLKNIPIEINFLENLYTLILPSSCYDTLNIGGLHNLQLLQVIGKEDKSNFYHIYENKMFIHDYIEHIDLPKNITHINRHRGIYEQLNELPETLQYYRTVLLDHKDNFPAGLKELHAHNSNYEIEELKIPFGCDVHIKNIVGKGNFIGL